MRLFVAVWPPPDVLSLVAALPRPAVDGVRWTTPDQWHVTLHFLGAVSDVDGAVDAFSSLSFAPVDAVAGPAVAALSRSILCVPVSGLAPVAAGVVAAVGSFGEPPPARSFQGHLTLARARDRRRGDVRSLAGASITASWEVREVCLVSSQLRSTGAVYETIATTSAVTNR